MDDNNKTRAQLVAELEELWKLKAVDKTKQKLLYKLVGFSCNKWFLLCLTLTVMSIILLQAAFPSYANETETGESYRIIVGGDYNYPPYEFLDENGEPTGYNVELTRAIAETMGMDIEIKLGPWGEIRKALESGNIHGIHGMFYSEERDKAVDFSPPHTIIYHAIFSQKDSPSIDSLEQLHGKEIIVMRGDIMHDFMMENDLSESPVLVDTQAEALQLLASGKHDYALIAKLPGLYWVRELKLDNIMVVGPLLRPSEYCYAVKEGNIELLTRFSEGLAILKETNQYSEIYNKWLVVLEPGGFSLYAFLKYTAIIIIPLMLLFAVSVFWSWSLRKQVGRRTVELKKEITEHKEAEEALRESEDKFRFMFETMISGFALLEMMYDENGNPVDCRYLDANPAHERLTGLKSEKIIGRTARECIPGLEDSWIENYGQVDKTGKSMYIENYVDGLKKWYGVMAYRPKPGFVAITFEDITEKKKTELDLKEMNKNLEDLVYITSHDLQSPLVSMEGFASKLLEDYKEKLGEDGEHRLIRLKENAKKMHDLVLSLLDLSRLNTEKFRYESFDPAKIIKEIISGDLSLFIEQADVVVKVEKTPEIYGDKKRIEGVFRRLILNSVMYGGKKIIVGFENGAYFVKDDGIGIPESQTEKIFSPGERLKVVKVEGTGMGLTFCRNVINKHNGEIWVEPEGENKGSTFYFTIEKHRR